MKTTVINKVGGLDKFMRDVERMGLALDAVRVTVRHTRGPQRSAQSNAYIAQVQKRHGRNPWFVDRKERKQLTALIDQTVKEIAAGRRRSMQALGERLGEKLIATFWKHFNQARNPRGKFRGVTRETHERKKKAARWRQASPHKSKKKVNRVTAAGQDRLLAKKRELYQKKARAKAIYEQTTFGKRTLKSFGGTYPTKLIDTGELKGAVEAVVSMVKQTASVTQARRTNALRLAA